MDNVLGVTYGTVSDIEILWVAISTIGILFAGYNFNESRKDIKALDRECITNGRRKIASASKFQDACRVVVHSIFVSIGITAMFIPDTSRLDLPTPQFVAGILIRWGLIVGAAVLVLQSYVAYRTRKEIVRVERHDLKNKAQAELLQEELSKSKL